MEPIQTNRFLFNRAHFADELKAMHRRRFVVFLGVGGVIMAPLIANLNASWILVLVFGAGYILITYFNLSNRIRSTLDQLAEAGLFSVPRWYEFDEEFFGLYTADGTHTKNRLEAVIKSVKRRDEYFVLRYRSKMGVMVIPYAAFASADDQQRFEAILQQKGLLRS